MLNWLMFWRKKAAVEEQADVPDEQDGFFDDIFDGEVDYDEVATDLTEHEARQRAHLEEFDRTFAKMREPQTIGDLIKEQMKDVKGSNDDEVY